MQENLNLLETELDPIDSASRRAFLARFAALGAGLAALQLTVHAQTSTTPSVAPMPDPSLPSTLRVAAMPKNEMEFRMAVAPVAMLSLEISRIAVNKPIDPAVRQFANFELAEVIAVTNVLQDLDTSMTPMNALERDALSKAQNASAGSDFDRDYIAKQRSAHLYLRDTATNYLNAPLPRKAKVLEKHGRHLATLNLPTFTEHIAHTEEIMARMTA